MCYTVCYLVFIFSQFIVKKRVNNCGKVYFEKKFSLLLLKFAFRFKQRGDLGSEY